MLKHLQEPGRGVTGNTILGTQKKLQNNSSNIKNSKGVCLQHFHVKMQKQ
jgi:hypothetical protein